MEVIIISHFLPPSLPHPTVSTVSLGFTLPEFITEAFYVATVICLEK